MANKLSKEKGNGYTQTFSQRAAQSFIKGLRLSFGVKLCPRCNKSVAFNGFPKSRSSKDGLFLYCKECTNDLWNPQWATDARNNRETKNGRSHDSSRVLKETFSRWLRNQPCWDCKSIFHYSAMQFDHRPDEKKLFTIAVGLRSCSMQALFDEVVKCDLVCANCHAVRTWKRAVGVPCGN